MAVRKFVKSVAASALAVAALMVGPHTASASPQYNPGNASAFAPYYNSSVALWQYHCVFNGWVHVTTNWTCYVYDKTSGSTVSQHTGSFSNGSYTTPTYYFKKVRTSNLCTVAEAGYFDGSASDSNEKCTLAG